MSPSQLYLHNESRDDILMLTRQWDGAVPARRLQRRSPVRGAWVALSPPHSWQPTTAPAAMCAVLLSDVAGAPSKQPYNTPHASSLLHRLLLSKILSDPEQHIVAVAQPLMCFQPLIILDMLQGHPAGPSRPHIWNCEERGRTSPACTRSASLCSARDSSSVITAPAATVAAHCRLCCHNGTDSTAAL